MNMKIKSCEMPEPDAIIDYGNGRTGMAMFFYGMPEDTDAARVANANGFDAKFKILGDDGEEELAFRYERGEDPFAIAADWHPAPPEGGFVLAEIYDTEDGLAACFVRRLPQS
jgi:hypothetical protein